MADLTFENIHFKEEKENLRAFMYNIFYFDIPLDEVKSISEFSIKSTDKANDTVSFDVSEKRANNKFSHLIGKYINNLTNQVNGKPTVYIHQNSGIPLFGNGSFGIVDRGTNLIEIKPITSCNLDCIYCSINEPLRAADFIVEPDYMVSELAKLCKFKDSEDIEIHIGCQGEPLLYSPLSYMISKISEIPKVNRISMDTNAVMITKKKADELIDAGLTQFNISINSLDDKQSKDIANAAYSTDKIQKITTYISKKSDILIAPVIMPTVNEEVYGPIIEFAKELRDNSEHKIRIGFQKFLNYKFGKNPVKEISWDPFFANLKELEEKYDFPLIFKAEDFFIKSDKEYPKPFKKNQIVKAQVVCDGRMNHEKIAVAEGRTISIASCHRDGSVKIKILRTKHNIFFGILA